MRKSTGLRLVVEPLLEPQAANKSATVVGSSCLYDMHASWKMWTMIDFPDFAVGHGPIPALR